MENRSYLVIIIAVVLIGVGMLLGSFVKYTIFLASAGSLFLIIGIIMYIASQLMESK